MQDICAWSTQIAWNGHGLDAPPEVVQSAHGYGLGCDDAGVPVMAILDVVHAEQTLARQLWQPARAEDGSEQTVIRCPARFALSPETIPVPARALGLDTADILRELGLI
jgi:crotonobetainyl-CoA:carnitine CoA-transferase CaiB-like acyl-CoA transferase